MDEQTYQKWFHEIGTELRDWLIAKTEKMMAAGLSMLEAEYVVYRALHVCRGAVKLVLDVYGGGDEADAYIAVDSSKQKEAE